MKRNVRKTIERGKQIIKKNDRLDLTLSETEQFFADFDSVAQEKGVKEALYTTIGEAYEMGLAVGMRNSREVTA